MNIKHHNVLLAVVLLLPVGAWADYMYEPYNGYQGYQQIAIETDLYYVAAHGSRKSDPEEVDAAWRVRVAELCQQSGQSHFVELRYSFESLKQPGIESRRSAGPFTRVGSYRYNPVPLYYVPPKKVDIFIAAPSRQGHVRCLSRLDELQEPQRAEAIEPLLQNGKQRGWLK